MPKFQLDGNEIEFKPGQTIIQAAADAGITIPHFCWHPSLSVSGNCRVCLVEVERMPKLVIACSTMASEGMVVHTQSEKTLSARNAVMEFLLINHPLDCPICDEAGECKLQDYAFQHSTGESRFVEEKVHKDKRVELGPHVMFDAERCISCSRCIRFCDEIAGEPQLTFVKRGDRVTIVTFPGKQLDNPYSLNVTDICPVGALTNRDFRFNARVWDMSSTKSVCTGCARGCNIDIWVRSNEILRLTPRFNPDVNQYWMCDEGRLNTFRNVNAENRIDGSYIRKDGELRKVHWDESMAFTISELKAYSKEEIGFIGSAFATVEDNYMLVKLAKTLGVRNLDFARHIDEKFGDNILRQSDRSPNAMGAMLAGVTPGAGGLDLKGMMNAIESGKIKALFILEDDLAALDTKFEELLAKLDFLAVLAVNFNTSTKYANVIFPASSYAEKHGTWVNFQGRIQRIRPAVAVLETDRSLDGLSLSRLDKFGTEYDRWGKVKKVDARPSWRIISGLVTLLGNKTKYGMAEEVFSEIASNISAFHGIDYDSIGETGCMLTGVTSAVKV